MSKYLDRVRLLWQDSPIASSIEEGKKTTAPEVAQGTGWPAEPLGKLADNIAKLWQRREDETHDLSREGIIDILKSIGANDEIANRIAEAMDKMTPDVPVIKSIMQGLLNLLVLLATVGGDLTGLYALARQGSWSTIRPATGSTADLLVATFRGLRSLDDTDQDWGILGVPKHWQQILWDAGKQIINTNDVAELYRRGILTKAETIQALYQLGFVDQDQAEYMRQLAERWPDMQTLYRLYRRGSIPQATFDKYIHSFGLPDDLKDAYTDITRPWPDVSMLAELGRRGCSTTRDMSGLSAEIDRYWVGSHPGDPIDYAEQLRRLGYADEIVNLLQTMEIRPPDVSMAWEFWAKHRAELDDLRVMFKQLGFNPAAVESLVELRYYDPTPSDLVQFGVKDVFDADAVRMFGMDAENPRFVGNTAEFNKWLRRSRLRPEAWDLQWMQHWRLPGPQDVFDMFHRGVLGPPGQREKALRQYLKNQDYSPFWRDKMAAISFNLIPRRTLASMLTRGLIGKDDALWRFMQLGYSNDDAQLLVKDALNKRQGDEKDLSKAEVLRFYKRYILTRYEAKSQLMRLGYDGDEADLYLAEADLDIADRQAIVHKDTDEAALGRAREQTTKHILDGLRDGLIVQAEAVNLLMQLGYSSATTQAIINNELLEREIERRSHVVDLIGDMVTQGAISIEAGRTKLVEQSIPQTQVENVTRLWSLELERQQTLREHRTKGPSKADLNRWLDQGVIDVNEYRDGLERLGYDDMTIARYIMEAAIKQMESKE